MEEFIHHFPMCFISCLLIHWMLHGIKFYFRNYYVKLQTDDYWFELWEITSRSQYCTRSELKFKLIPRK